MKILVFKVFSDKSQYKIRYRHLFEDFSLSSDGVGSELGKRHIVDLQRIRQEQAVPGIVPS